MNKKQPHLVILATGGTIASSTGDLTGAHYGFANIGIETLIANIPEINQLARLDYEQIAQIDSTAMTLDLWLILAKRAATLLARDDIDGLVITHGTDTAEETAYFLSLVVPSSKPIVITGAMRPAASLSADGLRNLYNAVIIASSPASHGKGVLLTFNDVITAARDVTKTNVSSTDSFRAPELGLLGYVTDEKAYLYKQPLYRHTTTSEFNIADLTTLPKVEIIYGYADSDPCVVDALVQHGAQGLISAGLGKGLQTPSVLTALARACKQQVIVVRSSRVQNGVITREPDLDDTHGFIASNTLSPQKARILLTLALTKTKKSGEIQRMFDEY